MLRFLRVKRLAVIDSAEVEFGPGFNVLTGETGAGKSILVEAVGLLLGGRASPDLVRTGEDTASVEALFEAEGREILLRREVTSQGRSRAFIDGSLATAGALKDLSTRLVEMHGQHEHHTLLDSATHLAVLDAFGAHLQSLGAVAEAFAQIERVRGEAAGLRERMDARDVRLELARFQLAEILKAALVSPTEDEELSGVRNVLANAERIEHLCREAYEAIYDRDDSVLAALGGVWRRVAELAAIDGRFLPHVEARDAIKAGLEDLALLLRRYADGVEVSPERLQLAEERLALLERLKRKHGPTLADVIATRDRLSGEVAELDRSAERAGELDREVGEARARYLEVARQLSRARRRAGGDFSDTIVQLLGELALERTRFEVRFSEEAPESRWSGSGVDAAEFFVSSNPGEALRPLTQVVSGGELSRIMLAIKTMTATGRRGFSGAAHRPPSGAAPGLVFDEIDAGIGGRVASIVGQRLRALGSASQVLCLTHLPQVAALADMHFVVEKRVEAGRTRTTVRRLAESDRVDEVSRMIGGTNVTEAVKASARELLSEGAKGESERAKRRGAQTRGPR